MEWSDLACWNLINSGLSVLAVVATVYIGRYTVKKQRQYAREQAYIISYCEFPVDIIEHTYHYSYLAFRLKDIKIDPSVKGQFYEDLQDKEQKINDIIKKLKSSGSPEVGEMSNLMRKLKYEFAIKRDRKSASRLLAIAHIISVQMRSEIISKSLSAVKQVEIREHENAHVTKEEIIHAIVELCDEHKFPKVLAKR